MTTSPFRTLVQCIDSGDYTPLYGIDPKLYDGNNSIESAFKYAHEKRRAISLAAHFIASGMPYITRENHGRFFLEFGNSSPINGSIDQAVDAIGIFADHVITNTRVDDLVLQVKAVHAQKVIKNGESIDAINAMLFLIAYEAMKEREVRLADKTNAGVIQSPKTGEADFVVKLGKALIENSR